MNPDGISDSFSDGIDHILSVLLDRYVSGHHPDNIDEFQTAWRSQPSFGHGRAMVDIWHEHGRQCCNGIPRNVDLDAGEQVDIADLTYLVDFQLHGGPPLPYKEEGDANGSGAINIADLTKPGRFLLPRRPLPPLFS